MVVFYDVDLLYPQAFAGAQHRAGVLGLVDVFQHNGDMAGPLPQDLSQTFPAFLVDETGQVIDDFLLFVHQA